MAAITIMDGLPKILVPHRKEPSQVFQWNSRESHRMLSGHVRETARVSISREWIYWGTTRSPRRKSVEEYTVNPLQITRSAQHQEE